MVCATTSIHSGLSIHRDVGEQTADARLLIELPLSREQPQLRHDTLHLVLVRPDSRLHSCRVQAVVRPDCILLFLQICLSEPG